MVQNSFFLLFKRWGTCECEGGASGVWDVSFSPEEAEVRLCIVLRGSIIPSSKQTPVWTCRAPSPSQSLRKQSRTGTSLGGEGRAMDQESLQRKEMGAILVGSYLPLVTGPFPPPTLAATEASLFEED